MAGHETQLSGHSLGPCPADEEIAAFVDGLLSGADRARLVAHLADCKACYQVFSGVVRFEEDAAGSGKVGRVVPFPLDRREERETGGGKRRGRSSATWWQVAAAAVLAIGIGLAGYRTLFAPPPLTVAGLTGPLLSRPEAAQNLYSLARPRGTSSSRPADRFAVEGPSFMVGVLLVDLQVASRTEDPRTAAAERLAAIGSQIGRMRNMQKLAALYQQDSREARASTLFASNLAAHMARREAELDRSLDRQALAFGKWGEACRLAAVIRSRETFASRSNRLFLAQALRWQAAKLEERRAHPRPEGLDLEAEGTSAVLATLGRIEAHWGSGDPAPRYADLRQDFGELIDHYDR